MSGQFNVASHNCHIAADYRGSLDLCIPSDHANVSADLCVPFQFYVTADNHKVAADTPFQSQVVTYKQQVARDLLVFTNPYIAAEHGNIALDGPDSDFASHLPGL